MHWLHFSELEVSAWATTKPGRQSVVSANQRRLEDEKKEKWWQVLWRSNRNSQRSLTAGGGGFQWSGKEPGDVGRREAWLSGHMVQCLFCFLLSLGLELFPKGPLQLRDRQSEGEGAVRLRPDDPSFKMTGGEKHYDTIMTHILKPLMHELLFKTDVLNTW